MSEVTDVVVPILQRLQADVAELKRDAGGLTREVETMSDGMDKIESYITYSLGMMSQNKADLDCQGRSLLEIGRRVEALENA